MILFRSALINAELNAHFPSNKGNWKVSDYLCPEMHDCISITNDCTRDPVPAISYVTRHIFKMFPSVNSIYYGLQSFNR